MSFGTFTLTSNEGIVGGAPAMGKIIVRVASSTSQMIRDTAGNKVWHGPKSVPLRSDGSWSVDLPSDSTTGNSTTIAYEVSSDLKNVANLPVTTFYARPINTTLPFTPLINETVVPLTPTGVSQTDFASFQGSLPSTYSKVTEAPLNASRYTSLQAAADAMPAAGGDLRIPAGTYTGDVSFKPKTRVIGAGRGATFIAGTVTFNSAEGNSLSDVTINPTANGTGLKIVGAHRSSFQRINIERGANGTGTGLQITASGGVPVFYNNFEDISITHFAGGGRGLLMEAVTGTDWITSCSFKRITMRGDATVKMSQGVRVVGPGVVQHMTWEDCYVEYVTFEGWFFDTTVTYSVMIDVITEVAGTAYALYGNYVTALNVNGFSNTVLWDFGPSAGHRILGPQLSSLDMGSNGVFKTPSVDLGTTGVLKASPNAAKVSLDVGGGTNAAAGDLLAAYGIGRGDPNTVGTTQVRGGTGDSVAHGVDLYVNGKQAVQARGNGAGSKVELSDARDIVVGTTTGSKIGTATGQKLAFYGNTPVVRPTLTYSRATETAAGAGLRAALVALGLVTDSTVA